MFSLFSLLFLFRFGSLPSPDAQVSFRAEAREIAVEAAARSVPVEAPSGGRGSWQGFDLPLLHATGPVVGPLLPAYLPKDWVSSVAQRLNIADHPLAKAAIWMSGIPVEVDARTGPRSRVGLKLTLRCQ
jgi:hypothetical protein